MKLVINRVVVLAIIAFSVLTSCKDQKQQVKPEKSPEDTIGQGQNKSTNRLVSLNGAITEIIAELGKGKDITGVDVTSTFPKSVVDHATDLGHVRSLNAEQVLALKPTMILGLENDISAELRRKFEESDVETHFLSREFSVEGTKKLIDQIGEILNKPHPQKIKDQIDRDLKEVEQFKKPPKVLFIYARGPGTMMVAGQNTPMQKMVDLAGGRYSISGFESFKPLTPEALIKQNPDVLLLFDSGLKSLGGKTGLLKVAGVSQTKAGKNKAVITMDGGLLTSFGPRMGKAAVKLNKKLNNFAK